MTYQFARQLSFWVDSEGKTEKPIWHDDEKCLQSIGKFHRINCENKYLEYKIQKRAYHEKAGEHLLNCKTSLIRFVRKSEKKERKSL